MEGKLIYNVVLISGVQPRSLVYTYTHTHTHWASLVAQTVKNAGDPSLIPGLGRSLGEGNGYPPQYSSLENPMDGGSWRATVYRVTESHPWLSAHTVHHSVLIKARPRHVVRLIIWPPLKWKTDWFQIGKGVHQGCILSPSLFNLYAEYIMPNSGLDKAQAGIKISGRSINNLR